MKNIKRRRTMPHILLPHDSGICILCFNLGRFRFRWFTDEGEWFVYLFWKGKKLRRVLRLSSAGCYYSTGQ